MANPRIVIVADAAGSELAARLSTFGYPVAATASTAGEALAVITRAEADLVLMEMTSVDASQYLAAADAIGRESAIPIVLMGTAEDEVSLQKTGSAESFDFLVQPFSDRELRTTLDLALCRHRAARAVHDIEAFFAISLDMFCFLGFDGYFRRLNPAWERTLGFTREELMSRPFIEFVHPDDRERTLNQNAQVRGGGQATGFENRYVCKDGSYRWLMWNASPLLAAGVIYSAARDVTVRKQAEEDRSRLVAELEASLAEVRSLQDILPICMYCKRVRDDEDYWQTVEGYIAAHTNTRFSHGICPTCMASEVDPHFLPDTDI